MRETHVAESCASFDEDNYRDSLRRALKRESGIEKKREDIDDVMFADEFCKKNEPKVETSSDVPENIRQTSETFGNVRMAFEQHSDNLRRSSVWKLLKM